MGCNGCPGKETSDVDKRGNVFKDEKAAMEDRPEENYKPKELPPDLKNMPYQTYIKEKSAARNYGKKMGLDAVRTFSTEHKRIQIKELIDVVNHEDGGPLSPTQALQALFDFSNLEEYTIIFNEFVGLKQQVTELYKRLVESNKISVEWRP